MAFSIRNIFQKGGPQEVPPGGAAAGGPGEFMGFGGAAAAVAQPGQGGRDAGPGFGASIFKVREEEGDMQGQPVNSRPMGSPFSPFGAAESVTLTVGDLLPKLPPELVRGGSVSPDQPVAISPQALEAALADGSLAVPVFEVYRVCPALFQVPVSPQDPRVVQLPQSKLVALMSAKTGMMQMGAGPSQPGPSHFGSAPAASPFAMSAPSGEMTNPGGAQPMGVRPAAGSLPPRRPAGVPPALPVQPEFAAPSSLKLPGQEEMQMPGSAPASPFSFQSAAPQSPFAAQPVEQASPFGTAPSPFGQPGQMSPNPHQGLGSMTSLLSSQSSPVTDPELSGSALPSASPFSGSTPSPFAAQGPVAFAPQSAFGTAFGAPEAAPSPFAAQSPGVGAMAAHETSPGSPFAAPSQLPGSPFAQQPPQPPAFAQQVPQASPFTQASGGSPFAAPEPSASPFAMRPAGSLEGPASPFSAPQEPIAQPSFASPPMGNSPFSSAAPPSVASPFSPPAGGGEPPLPSLPLGGSPFAAPASASPFAAQPTSLDSPFAPTANEVTPFVAPGSGSPFLSGGASFEPTPRQVTPEPPKLGAVPFGSTPGVIFVNPIANKPAAPAATLPAMGGPSYRGEESVDISLAAILKGQSPDDLGFDPNFIPAWINTKLPTAQLRSQLASGQVLLDLGQIIDGTENTFRMVIAHGKREFKVRVPANEIFHLLPPVISNPVDQPGPPPVAVPTAPPTPASAFLPVLPEAPTPAVAPSPPVAPTTPPSGGIIQPIGFQLPFSSPMPTRGPEPAASPTPEPEPQKAPVSPKVQPIVSFDPFAANAGDWGGKSQTANFEATRAGEEPTGLGSEQLFAQSAEPPRQAAAPSPFPPAPPTAGLPAFAAPTPLPPRSPTAPLQPEDHPFVVLENRKSQPLVTPVPESAPVAPAAVHPVKGPSVSVGTLSGDPEQMLLRALLGSSDRLTPDNVVAQTARLPGVLAAVAVQGDSVMAYGGADKPSQDFQRHAAETARSMHSLASLIGFEGAETLSITSGDRLITFSFSSGLSFGVLHADREPASGLRDKITLIGRELATLMGRS